MNTTFESFGDWLRHWRKQSGLTQQDVADKLNRTPALISNWERGVLHGESGAVALPSAEQARSPVREALKMIGIDVEDAQEQSETPASNFADRYAAIFEAVRRLSEVERERAFAILAATFHEADVLIPSVQYTVEEIPNEEKNSPSLTILSAKR